LKPFPLTGPYARALFAILIVLTLTATGRFLAQSGRHKEEKKGGSKVRPTPIDDSNGSDGAAKSSNVITPRQSSSSQESSDEVESSDVVRVSSNLVPIPASVVDTKGYAITGLGLDDFELRIDGQLRSISDMTRSETPVRLAMLFDNSGSIDFAREFEKQAAMKFFRKVMRPVDEAAIYSIETESYLAQPLTSDIRRLEQTIATFGKPEGSTSLFDALIDAARYLRPYPGRRVIVIVSDGVDTTSQADFESTIQHLLGDDCQVFIVQTGLYVGANLRALAAERRMEQLSAQTGGAVYIPKTIGELDTAFAQIAADLAQQYVLSYYPGGQHRDGQFHSIDLRIKSRKDVRVRARRGYYSPKPTNLAARES
jgi:Ca-activated chloride channel homolog